MAEEVKQEIKLLTEKELGAYLGRSLPALWRDRHLRRGVPYIKIGGSIRYRMDDVEAYLQANRIEGSVQKTPPGPGPKTSTI